MDSFVSSENLSMLRFADPYISHLGISRANFLVLIVLSLFILLYFLFGKQLYQFKEKTKASLRSQIQAFTLNTQLSEDGKTLETTENPSFFARVLSTLDNIFLTPDNHAEGFVNDDDDDEEDDDESEEGFEDGAENDRKGNREDKDDDDEDDDDENEDDEDDDDEDDDEDDDKNE